MSDIRKSNDNKNEHTKKDINVTELLALLIANKDASLYLQNKKTEIS